MVAGSDAANLGRGSSLEEALRHTLHFRGDEQAYQRVLGVTAVLGPVRPELLAAGLGQPIGSFQKFLAPPGMIDLARQHCTRAQYLNLLPLLEACPACRLDVDCFVYTDLNAFG